MGWLNSLFEYSISQEGVNEIYRQIVDSEIGHSENYLRLYQTAKQAGNEDLVKQTRGYVVDSMQSLSKNISGATASGKVSINLDDKVREQIKKLRKVVD